MKKVGCVIVIVLVAVIIGGYLLIRNYLNEERLTRITKDFLSQAFKKQVEVKRVSLKLGLGVKINVDDIRVPNNKGYEAENMLEIENMALNVALLPLISKKIVINKTEISEPRANIEKKIDGKMNLPPIPIGKAKGKGFELDLKNVVIKGGIISYHDHKEKKHYLIQNLNQTIGGRRRGIKFDGNGRFLYRDSGLKEPLTLKFDDHLELDTTSKELKIYPSKVLVGKAAINLEGTVGKKTLDVKAQGRDVNIEEFIKLIPTKNRAGIQLAGAVNTDLKISGDVKKPKVNFSLAGKGVTLGTNQHPDIGKLDLMVEGDENKIDAKQIVMKRRNSRLELAGAFFPKKNSLNITGSGKLYGQDLQPFLPGLKGNINLKLTTSGSLKKPTYKAEIKMSDGYYGDLKKIKLDCVLSPDNATIKKLDMIIYSSDLSLSGSVKNFSKPYADIYLKSKNLDIDKMKPKDGGNGKVGLPKITAKVNFAIDQLKVEDNILKRVRGSATYSNQRFKLEKVDFQAYDGSGSGSGEVSIIEPPPYRFQVNVRDLNCRKLFKKFLGIDNISGKFRARIKTNGKGFNPKDVQRNLDCDGQLSLSSGEFVNFGFTNKLLEWLKIVEGGKFKFKDINAAVKIRKGRVRFDDVLVQTRSADYLLFGTLGFDERIDYRITITFNPTISKKLKKLHANWLFYSDSRGRMIIDIFAKGTLSKPKFSLDKKKIQTKLKSKIKDWWEKEKKKLLNKWKKRG